MRPTIYCRLLCIYFVDNAPIVSYLLEHGADSLSSIGGQSSANLAKELGHTYIHELLVRHDTEELTPRAETSEPTSSN